MKIKLIIDRFNSDRYQWRYFDKEMGLWFDYGEAYETREDALNSKADIIERRDWFGDSWARVRHI